MSEMYRSMEGRGDEKRANLCALEDRVRNHAA